MNAGSELSHDDDDNDGDIISVNMLDIRMECLRLASNMEMPADTDAHDVLMVAESFVKFVLEGTTPAQRN